MAFQNPSRFITANAGPTPSSDRENEGDEHVSQDLTLQLLQCCDEESLGSAVRDGLSSYIPEVYGGALFYVDETTGDVITADNAGLTVCIPDPDCIKQAYGEKQEVILSVQSIPQCVLEQLGSTDGRSFTSQTQVICSPVFKGQNGSVSAVLVIALDDITSKVAEKLSWLKKQIAACYSHIQRTFQGRAAEERASQQLIKLCGELYDQDASKLQLKVLKYLEDQTQAECAFLLLVVPETQELFCQVIGKRILEEEIRFPGQSSSFSVALETKQPINLDDIPVENRKCIEEVIEIPLRSFLCVPVTSRNDDNLIALACLVNKQNGNRFTDRDVTCIRQCFRYTATVLTSTLAFQNERKIKIQTQALLQVARHLFTNLGELMTHKPRGLDNFPYIRSRHWEVNVMGTNFLDAISTNRFNKKPFSNIREVVDLSPMSCVSQACTNSQSDVSKTSVVQCGSMVDKFCRCMQEYKCSLCEYKDSLGDTCQDNDAVCSGNEEGPAAQKFSLDGDTSLASVGPDEIDKESDYASAFASGSDNAHTSQGTSEEIDSSFSYQTATDSESTCIYGVGRNHKKAHHRINSTSPSKQRSFDKCRMGMEDSTSDVALSFRDGRLSNSEPCIPAKRPASNVSKADVVKAITNDSHECVDDKVITSRESSGSVLAESLGASESESGHDGHGQIGSSQASIFQITLDKVDISDIQSSPTELVAITENDLTKLLREVMAQARNLTQAERCSVFLIDDETDELVAKVFDGITKTKDNEVQEEIRMPSTQGIAGHVATSGELLNIKDAYSHPLFYRGIDDSTGFRTRNILCFPIKNEEGKIMGVAQLCNKKTGPFFTQFDEDLATAFGIYCCISISHSLLYKKVIDSQVRNSLANELMMYHMKSIMYNRLQDSQHRKSLANELMIYHMQVSPEDVTGLTSVEIPHPRFLDPDFVEFRYAPRSLPDSKTLLACLSMFEDLNLISRWRIKRDCLARFILMVKKGYRNPPYHNWTHAYTVAQFCYQLAKNMKLEENYLDGIEIYALFVSCLCHDIDHRGTNNSFQTASKSVLAALYSSEGSVLERHHFAQTMCILNTEGCNIFEHLTSKEYQQMLDLIRDIILATDLAHHLKILKNIREMSVRGYDRKSVKDHKLLLCLLMTSCDLSDQTKPWNNTKNVAALIYKEFFTQGDMEKASGFQPAEMMDRERAQIPEVQIGFLDHIALPVYQVLSDIFPEGKEISEAVENNKKHWEKIRNFIKLKRGGSCARMTFDEVIAIESEADDEVMEESSEQLNHSVSNGSG